jgi:MFS family permease
MRVYGETVSQSPSHWFVWYFQIILLGLFFLSGCSALIYQVAWQRLLYPLVGVDITSITIVISVFMFGLGIGGLIGGIVVDKIPHKLLRIYILIELGIAIFGLVSPILIAGLAHTLTKESLFTAGVMSFFILCIPTLLMGATFPILVAYINSSYKNIGRSVGSLYFANTLGGAVGAYLTDYVLLFTFNLEKVIYIAAAINIFIVMMALITFGRNK